MPDKTVKVIKPETNTRLTGDAGKSLLGITPSKNALSADQTGIVSVPDFKSALPVVNQEARFTIKTPEGDMEVDHRFQTEADLEANSKVDSKSLEKAGALYQIQETREMLIKRAFLAEWSNQLKTTRNRIFYSELLGDEDRKIAEVKKLREAAARIRSLNNQNQ